MKKVMGRRIFTVCMTILLITACNIPLTATATPPTGTPNVTATATADTGGVVTINNISFTLPLGVAEDAQSEMVPAANDANTLPWWEVMPAHQNFTLTGYQVQNKFHEPQIFIFPAEEYARLNPAAAGQIERLKGILAGTPLSKDAMPGVPFFNAAQQIASHMSLISFKNGRGVRFVTQHAQYAAPINNNELFYHFQGLTEDGKYYIVAVLPVTSSILAGDEKPESPVPPGGVPIPTTTGPDQAYYDAVTQALDAMYEDSFNPSLFQLDALIQSISVTP